MKNNIEAELRKVLLDRTQFAELASGFVNKVCEDDPDEDPEFNEVYKLALNSVVEENIENVFSASGSPIETIFLNSLILGFIKVDSLGLVVHPVYNDTEKEIEQFIEQYEKFKKFILWYENKYSSFSGMNDFLDLEVKKGNMPQEERDCIARLVLRYHMLPLHNSFHLTLQPKFPNIKIDGKTIRPDILLWIPEQPELKIVVECDGFDYHSDREKFTSDRKRDRALQAKGYQILRYSGTEIYRNPAGVTADLAQHLWEFQETEDIQP